VRRTGAGAYADPMASLPLIGDFNGTVVGVGAASIHGDRYYDLLLVPGGAPMPTGEAAIRAAAVHARLPAHLCPRLPAPGDRVKLSMLLGQVQGAVWGGG